MHHDLRAYDGKWVQPNPHARFLDGRTLLRNYRGNTLRQILSRFLFPAQFPTYSLM